LLKVPALRLFRKNRGPADRPEAVEQAMARLALEDTAENRADLFRMLLAGELFVAMPDGPEQEQTRVTGEGEDIPVVLLDSEAGPVLPVFTRVERMLEWKPEGCGYLATSGRTVFEMAEANAISNIEVNPASPTRGSIEHWEIEVLSRGRLPIQGREETPAGARLKVGTPAAPPSDNVIQAVTAALASEPRARRAWLFLFQIESDPPEHAVAIEFDEGIDPQELDGLVREIVQRAGDRVSGVQDLIFVPVDDFLRGLAKSGTGELIFEC
jgi:SseB protein N-terminal domain/SseB protein C-terminal domain